MKLTNKFKTKNGITLIALVITIVVMLILAGVTINLTLGENGIFTTAQKAAKNYTEAQEKELAELNNFEATLNNTLSGGEELLNGTWSAKNKVNKPKLANTGLTPVTINANGTYGIPDIEKDSWYSYDGETNHWANARTKDGSMWVWIPRFAYKLDETNKIIDVVFLQGTTNKDYNGNDVTLDTYVDSKNATGAYIVHPAFRDGSAKGLNNGYANGEWNAEIPGFWMAKFEAGYVGKAGDVTTAVDSTVSYTDISNSTSNYYGIRAVGTAIKYPTFQANRPSMNYISISDAYKLCRSIQSATSVYGLRNIDSHMTKNSEWGAVAYLSYSKYGKSGEVVLNNISLRGKDTVYAVTGYAAKASTGTDASTVTTTWDKIENGSQEGSWLTSQGQTGSTTGNIYGVYDMSGGLWERTAGYVANGHANLKKYGESVAYDEDGNLKTTSTKYTTVYPHDSSVDYINTTSTTDECSRKNYELNISIFGDTIRETSTAGIGTSAWCGEYSIFAGLGNPFFTRGAGYDNGSSAGVPAFDRTSGISWNTNGFRSVLVAL